MKKGELPTLEWSFDDAKLAQEAFEAEGGSLEDTTGPIWRWYGLQRIEEHRKAFDESGDGAVLLGALAFCCIYRIEPPVWLCTSYLERFDSAVKAEAASWNEAFGRPFKGVHLQKFRDAGEKRWLVYAKLRGAQRRGALLEPQFDLVGQELGLHRGKVIEFWNETRATIDALGGPDSEPGRAFLDHYVPTYLLRESGGEFSK